MSEKMIANYASDMQAENREEKGEEKKRPSSSSSQKSKARRQKCSFYTRLFAVSSEAWRSRRRRQGKRIMAERGGDEIGNHLYHR